MFVAYSNLSGTTFSFHEGWVCAHLEKGIYTFYSIKKKLALNLRPTHIIQHNNIVLCYHQLSLKLTKDYQKESSHDSYNMVTENKQKYLKFFFTGIDSSLLAPDTAKPHKLLQSLSETLIFSEQERCWWINTGSFRTDFVVLVSIQNTPFDSY